MITFLVVFLAGSAKGGFPPLQSIMSKENIRRNKNSVGSTSDLDRMYFEPPSSIMNVIENQTASMSRDLQQAQKKTKDLHSEKLILQDQVCSDRILIFI